MKVLRIILLAFGLIGAGLFLCDLWTGDMTIWARIFFTFTLLPYCLCWIGATAGTSEGVKTMDD